MSKQNQSAEASFPIMPALRALPVLPGVLGTTTGPFMVLSLGLQTEDGVTPGEYEYAELGEAASSWSSSSVSMTMDRPICALPRLVREVRAAGDMFGREDPREFGGTDFGGGGGGPGGSARGPPGDWAVVGGWPGGVRGFCPAAGGVPPPPSHDAEEEVRPSTGPG